MARRRRFLPPSPAPLLLSLLLVAGCTSAPVATQPAPIDDSTPAPAAGQTTPPAGRLTILAINDVYRIEGVEEGARGGLARLRSLRSRLERSHPDLLVLHAGDFLYPSFASRTFHGAQMISILNLLDGDPAAFDGRMFITFGNHELDPGRLEDAADLDLRVEESAFYWLGTNVTFAAGDDGRPRVEAHNLLPHALVESGGVKVGLFSLTIGETHPPYVATFDDPHETARRLTAELRRAGAQVVVALTHLNVQDDALLLHDLAGDGPDLIVGGHDHQRMAREVNGRWVLKADADAVTATVIQVGPAAQPGAPPSVRHHWVELGPEAPDPDPAVATRVAEWGRLHDHLFCSSRKPPLADGCLDDPLGTARVELVAEELEIRRFETNFGNWIADRLLDAFDEPGERPAGVAADLPLVGFVNSGSLRLNQDVPAGPVRRRHVEELFAYPTPTVLLRLDGRTLKQVLAHSVEGWTGSGWWLQVAGLAFRHDPQAGTATDVTLLTPDGPRPLADDDEVLAVTGRYLVDPAGNQDGYRMLGPHQVVAEGPELEARVVEALREAGGAGIAPEVEGRICNPVRPERPCRAADIPE